MVTVVIPTRNRIALLRRSIRSVQAQRGISFEVIVVDDHSIDETSRVIASLGDDRIQVLRTERPGGAAVARNLGIGQATGRWIAFFDDDDLWAPDKLAKQLEAMSGSGRLWAYSGAVFINPAGRIRGGAPPPSPDEVIALLPRYNPIPAAASNVIVAAEVIAETGGFDPSLIHMTDWDLWLRIAARMGPPACSPAPSVAYHLHGGNFSARPAGIRKEVAAMKLRHPTVDSTRIYRHMSGLAIGSGRWLDGLSLLWSAVRGPDRYALDEIKQDGQKLLKTAAHVAGRRIGRDLDRAERRRHDRLVETDPNRPYKNEARAWLDDINASGDHF
jgi:glycosyltransferase involved in cell wall biosynthesis